MRDAAREPADGIHLRHLLKMLLKLNFRRDVPGDADQADARAGRILNRGFGYGVPMCFPR